MPLDLPSLPPWLEGLPRDQRGYPVPAESGWTSGTPILPKVDIQRKVALGLRRRCAVCGYGMHRRDFAYRAFGEADADEIRTVERDVAVEPAGPAHRSCMLYSAMVCPYLRVSTARLGRDSTFEPGATRGASASVMGFRSFALLIYGERHPVLSTSAPAPQFAMLGLEVDIAYEYGDSLQAEFDEAVEADAARINTSKPRMYWTGEAEEVTALNANTVLDIQTIHQLEPIFDIDIAGVPYIGLRL